MFEPQLIGPCRDHKAKTKKLPLAAAIGILAMLLLAGDLRAQNIAPAASLNLDPPVEGVAQENYVLQRRAPAAIPFRPTISASAYDAAKQAAEAGYSPLGRKPAPFAPVPAAPPVQDRLAVLTMRVLWSEYPRMGLRKACCARVMFSKMGRPALRVTMSQS